MLIVNLEKLEAARKRKGLTKIALCKLVGIHPSTYTLILRRTNASPPTITRLAKAVGLEPDKAWKQSRKSA